MKQIISTILLSVICLCCLSACTTDISETQQLQNNQEKAENPFESNTQGSVVLGTIGHKPANTNANINEKGDFVYSGGEFTLQYEVVAEGSAKNVGFLIYVDGMPQPYKTSESASYEYLKNFTIAEDNVPEVIEFIFEPITGKASETVSMNIVSVYNAQFQPDMTHTTSFGVYHDALPSNQTLYFEQDASPTFSVYDMTDNGAVVTYESEKLPITSKYLEEEFSDGAGCEVTQELLDTVSKSYFTVNGKVQYDYVAFQRNDTVCIEYYLAGPQNIPYQTTFYLNHIPLSKDNVISTSTTLEKGFVEKITITLDAEKLDALTTFYAVSVPTNRDDKNGVFAGLSKTYSILLADSDVVNRKDEALSLNQNEDDTTTGDFETQEMSAHGFDTISVDNIGAEINNLFYAGEYMAVIADDIYLYDMKNKSIIAQADYQIEMPRNTQSNQDTVVQYMDDTEQPKTYRVMSFKKIENGYAAFIGMSDFTISACLLYDENLLLTKKIVFHEIVNLDAASADISNDGAQIAFCTFGTSGLYLYDTFDKTLTLALDGKNLETSYGILGVSHIQFFNNLSLIFCANTVPLPIVDGAQSTTTIATYAIDTKTLVNTAVTNYHFTQDMQVGREISLLRPDVRFDYSSIGLFDHRENAVRSFPLETENSAKYGAFLSSDQKHIMTLVKENEAWKICIYEVASNKKIVEKTIDFLEDKYYDSAGNVLFFDESNICALIVGVRGIDAGAQIICFSV